MATTLQPSFGLQQPEDSMEISSEYGNMDADIDIDLDAPDAADTNMQSFQVDDHQMQEDPRSDRPDDDLMIDDSNLDDTDRMMQDDAPPPQEQDEELLDFSEDEEDVPMNPVEPSHVDLNFAAETEAPAQQSITTEEPIELVQSEAASELLTEGVQPINAVVQPSEQASEQPQIEPVATQESLSEQNVTNDQPENITQESHEQVAETEVQPAPSEETQAAHHADSNEKPETHTQESVVESTEAPNATNEISEESAQVADQQPSNDQDTEQGNDNAQVEVGQEGDEQPAKRTLTRQETDLSNYTVPDDYSRERQVNSPTVTGLHPTIVEYQENEVYLFPSRDPAVPEQYLLQNENLVTTSLGDLLQACRTALGDGISEDEELVLGVEELDLYVSEVRLGISSATPSTIPNSCFQDSTPAFSTSFSELLDMYLQLHKLDGNDSPPPFRVSLTTKTRFSNRLASITQAISEGKGFSQLSFLQYYEYDEPTELPDEDFDDDFDELVEPDEPQPLIEEGVPIVESAQTVAEDEHAAENASASQAEQQHNEQTDPAQEGEYQGETSAEHDVHNDAVDQSEYNQDDTQYFDAQGGESELLEESHVDEAHGAPAEAQSTTGEPEPAAGDETNYADQHTDETVHDEHTSEHDEQEEQYEEHAEEQQEYETQGDEHVFGQGEFFDDNYEYQDGEVHEEEGAYVAEEEAITDESHYHEEQEVEASAAGEQDDNVVPPSGGSPHADEDGHDDEQDAQQDQSNTEQSVDDVGADAEHDNGVADGAVIKDSIKRQSLAVEDDDYDEINFDDEDSYDDDGTGLAPVLTNTSSKASPGAKRSFSELDQVDDEQDSKKARAS
ncbi:hypothetical protein E4T48_00513 [Aureobasidium sp. EXF-10727]|nr:hypothetical protein E4T48_00513 [Aureobasidium sp. EXF-10727]KAI4726528.1 hypothetical protein E4T49_05677 [Aureobasidium sp. EXF-10728]